MTRMKQIGLAAMFLFAASLLTSTPALAAKGWSQFHSNIQLVCVAPLGDPDSGASGRAQLDGYLTYWNPATGESDYVVDVTVTCSGLTPGETYGVGVRTGPWWLPDWPPYIVAVFTADRNGKGKATWSGGFENWIEVCVVRADDGTIVLDEQP